MNLVFRIRQYMKTFSMKFMISAFMILIILFFKDFTYLFDRQRSQVGREVGRERERGGSRLPAEQRPPMQDSIPGP